ncbi:MAG: transglutaminase TgpA family protein [Phycisphaerales bacterium]
MTIGRRLNQMIHACVALSIAAYTLAAEQPALLLIALAVLGLEFAFVSRIGGRALPRWVINTALVLATIFIIVELNAGGEGREFVSVIGRYLIMLQFIKLAEPKTPRNLGQALALTAMLAVGAVLTNVALSVGLLLLIYLPLLLASVVVFQLYSGQVETYGFADPLAQNHTAPPARQQRPSPEPAPAAPAIDRAAYAAWSARRARPMPAGRGLPRALLASIVLCNVAILAGSIALFLIIPRGIGESFLGARLPTSAGGARVTGFSPDLQLGGTGVISESAAIALYVQFSRDGNVVGAPGRTWYLRGHVMDEYDTDTGRWTRSDSRDRNSRGIVRSNADDPLDPEPRPGDLEQEIIIRNHNSEYLFSVFMPVAIELPEGRRLRSDSIREDGTIKVRSAREGLVMYTARSRTPRASDAGDEPGGSWKAVPIPVADDERDPDPDPDPNTDADADIGTEDASADPQMDPGAVIINGLDPGLRPRVDRTAWQFQEGPIADLAAEIAGEAGIDLSANSEDTPERRRRLAMAIEQHLAIRCAYTLDQPSIGSDEDPIEAFLFRTKRGHCEYFASASAALASAMGIPARVVTGFHVSEWDPAARRYIVRQSSAHAWTEVEIAPDQWLTIDPSAEDVRALNRPPTGLIAGVRRLIDQLEFLWVSRVVAFDSQNQQQIIRLDFGAIREALESLGNRVAEALSGDQSSGAPSLAGSVVLRVVVNFVVIAGTMVGAVLLAMFVWRIARSAALAKSPGAGGAIDDPEMRRRLRFYPALLRRLSTLGAEKPGWSPPALHIGSLQHEQPTLANAARRITELYYADRFGGRALTPEQIAEADALLDSITRHRPQPSGAPST